MGQVEAGKAFQEIEPTANLVYIGGGARDVDLVFEVGDRLVVIEAGGGAKRLGVRVSGAAQGTGGYLEEVVRDMANSGDRARRAMGIRLRAGLEAREVEYLVATTRWARPGNQTVWTTLRRSAPGR